MAAMDLAAPTTIAGRYELRARLGRGGTGEVWRGHDLLLDRPVAIKRVLLPPDLAAGDRAELRARVLREARAAARIDHRGSVQVYDVLEHDEIATIVMELVDGPDLGKVIASRGPLPPHEVARIGLELLTVLERAHAAGVLHRDVKPANVLLTGSGQPKLTDFGTAVLAGDDRLTASNTVLGSPAYMSPEQALGRPLGPETDLWSLGATLYHALEGVPPFAAGTAIATARQVVDGAIRPMVSSGPVSEAVRILLVKDPAVRATPRQVRRLLTEGAGSVIVLDPEESAAGEGPAVTGAGRGRRGRTALLAAAVACALLAVVVGVLYAVRATPTDAVVEPTPAPQAADAPAPTAVPVPDAAPTTAPTAVAPTTAPTAVAPTTAPTAVAPTTAPTAVAPTPAVAPPAPAPAPAASPAATPTATPTPEATAEASTSGSAGATLPQDQEVVTPTGWVPFAPEDAPYAVAHPDGWEVQRLDATRTDLADPASPTYLRLDWTDDPHPDPIADWEEYEQVFASSHSGYRRVQLTPLTYRGEPAALWEYTYEGRNGRVHAYNLNVSGDEYGYALNFVSSDAAWPDAEPLFWDFAASYLIVR